MVLERRIDAEQLRRLLRDGFGDMVKIVVDIERGCATVGGELHADGEQVLLERGSAPDALWGVNYYPGRGADQCLEFTALINIRPARGNSGMEIADPAVRERIRAVAHRLIGSGESL